MVRRAVSLATRISPFIAGVLVLLGLSLTSFHNYLLFHSFAELFSIVVACGIFMLFWNTRRFLDNGFYLFIGIAYLFVAGMDAIHTLAYTGMGVFPGYDTNLPTQLWIATRYVESLSLLAATLLIHRKLKSGPVFIGYAVIVSLLLGSIFYWSIFPDCFVEGVGLTLFKKVSEYIISLILLASIALLFRERDEFDEDVFRLLVASIVVTIASELCFTLYIHAYGLPNLIGHLLKIVSFYLMYKAFIEAGLTRPYDLLFRNLRRSEKALRESEKRYRDLFDLSLSGVALHEIVLDAEGQPVDYTFLEVNRAFEDLTGLSAGEVIGKRVTELFPGIEDTSVIDVFGRVALTGEPARFEQYSAPLDRHYAIAAFSPRQGQFASVFDDITERLRAEEALVYERDLLMALMDNTPDFMYFKDTDGRFLRVNRAFARLAGMDSPEELVGLTDFDYLPPGAAREFREDERKILESGQPMVGKIKRIPQADGEVHWRRATKVPIKDEEGRVTGIAGISTDITALMQAEEALRESEERYRTLAESSQDFIFIVDRDDRVEYVNQFVASQFGTHPEALIGKLRSDLFPPDISHSQESALGSIFETGEAFRGETPVRFGDYDGWHDTQLIPLRAETGEVTAVMGIARDITDRKRAEEALRESEEKYRGLFDHSLSGVGLHEIVLDANGHPVDYIFLEVNPAFEELTGISAGKIIGKRATEVLPGIEDSPFIEVYWRVALTGEPARFEQYAPPLDRHYAIAAFSPRQGQFAAVFDDITERVRNEEQIQSSLREKEVLLQEIHHRVKNNLAIVSSLLAWQSETIEDKQARAAFQESQNRIRSMARVHEHLYHAPDLAQVGMAEYIEDLVAYLGQSYGSYDLTLTTDAADVVLDLDRALPCGLIINELVSNCMQHAFPAGQTGEIRVAMHPLLTDEGEVELTVSDNGTGLPGHLDIDNIESLGLSVVRLLTRQLDGTLEVDRSEGTTFQIVFQVPDRTKIQEE